MSSFQRWCRTAGRTGRMVRRAARVAIGLSLPTVLVTLLTCTDAPEPTAPRESELPNAEAAAVASGSVSAQGTIPLPITQTVNSAGTAFAIYQVGTGRVAHFLVDTHSNSSDALQAITEGYGRAGVVGNANTANSNPALHAFTWGTGPASDFRIINFNSFAPTLRATTNG